MGTTITYPGGTEALKSSRVADCEEVEEVRGISEDGL